MKTTQYQLVATCFVSTGSIMQVPLALLQWQAVTGKLSLQSISYPAASGQDSCSLSVPRPMTDALTASGGVAFSRHGWAMQREAEAMQMVWLQEGFFFVSCEREGSVVFWGQWGETSSLNWSDHPRSAHASLKEHSSLDAFAAEIQSQLDASRPAVSLELARSARPAPPKYRRKRFRPLWDCRMS